MVLVCFERSLLSMISDTVRAILSGICYPRCKLAFYSTFLVTGGACMSAGKKFSSTLFTECLRPIFHLALIQYTFYTNYMEALPTISRQQISGFCGMCMWRSIEIIFHLF